MFANVKAHVKQEIKDMVPLCKLRKHYQIMLIIFFFKIKV